MTRTEADVKRLHPAIRNNLAALIRAGAPSDMAITDVVKVATMPRHLLRILNPALADDLDALDEASNDG